VKLLRRWMFCGWPGLDLLWSRGSWPGLAIAVGAALLLDFLLLASFVWSELVGPWLLVSLWMVVAVGWVVAAVRSLRRASWQDARIPEEDANSDLFRLALDQYLKGNWFESESHCTEQLRNDPRDADTLLLVATLSRRTRRYDEARRRLRELERLEVAAKWDQEILAERKRLDESEAAATKADTLPAGEASSGRKAA